MYHQLGAGPDARSDAPTARSASDTVKVKTLFSLGWRARVGGGWNNRGNVKKKGMSLLILWETEGVCRSCDFDFGFPSSDVFRRGQDAMFEDIECP